MDRAKSRSGSAAGDLIRLFGQDSVAGLGTGELLGRFVDRGDQVAFERLVERLGPMVLGVCRRILADSSDVDDAFQATFLVLVRRAGSIRDRDLVAAWLHGVAMRVARRARVQSSRRLARERLAVVSEAQVEDQAGSGSDGREIRALIDEEIDRLPEHHRRPVVLCDVEGLSREEAAQRLGWSLNMVRGRLERARERLRGRLARRGLAPSGGWASLMMGVPSSPSPAQVLATSRAALAFSSGGIGSGLASASAVALSRGVLRMMMFAKLKFVFAVVISMAIVAGGSGMILAQKPADPAPKPVGQVAEKNGGDVKAQEATRLVALGKSRVEMARKRLETQRKFYEEGRITIDRVLAASQTLMDAEVDVAETPAARSAAILAHQGRIVEIERRELAELEAGRATTADVEEIQTQRLDTEFRLARAASEVQAGKPSVADLERRISEMERKVDRLIQIMEAPKPDRR